MKKSYQVRKECAGLHAGDVTISSYNLNSSPAKARVEVMTRDVKADSFLLLSPDDTS